MSALVETPSNRLPSSAAAWSIRVLDETDSTNRQAAALPAWSAVTAAVQTAGRGRHSRSWVSDRGGLWLSAVLPTPGDPIAWSILPLAAGWALCDALASFGISDLRLRWPNDIMVGRAKLAGILVERFGPATAVVGLGVNFDNRPEIVDSSLAGLVAHVPDLAAPVPARNEVRDAILARLATAQAEIAAGNAENLTLRLTPFWRRHRVHVTLRPDHVATEGTFAGVDADGRLRLEVDDGDVRWLAPAEVELLREILPADTDFPTNSDL